MTRSEYYRATLDRLQALAAERYAPQLMYTQAQAAELLGVSRTTLWRAGIGRWTTLEELAEMVSKKRNAASVLALR